MAPTTPPTMAPVLGLESSEDSRWTSCPEEPAAGVEADAVADGVEDDGANGNASTASVVENEYVVDSEEDVSSVAGATALVGLFACVVPSTRKTPPLFRQHEVPWSPLPQQ